MECEKCGSKVFFVDETVTHVEVDGEIVKSHTGDLHNRNCVRCTCPEQHPEYGDDEQTKRDRPCQHEFEWEDGSAVLTQEGATLKVRCKQCGLTRFEHSPYGNGGDGSGRRAVRLESAVNSQESV